MKLKLNIWRQKDGNSKGAFQTHHLDAVSKDSSFLEMLDQLNEQLIAKGEEAVVFDHDCREGICGSCSLVINGYPHGANARTTTCQLYMREYEDGQELWIEPWRASAMPVIKDLAVDRSALDRIIHAGGYVSVRTGSAPEANMVLIGKEEAEEAFNAATCIGCGACVAVCPNASATLFLAAKVSHLAALPQGQIESTSRARKMSAAMEQEGFGVCSNHRHCEAVCPKGIDISTITVLNRLLGSS